MYLRGAKTVRRMLVRIQYLLFVLLFTLLSAVPSIPERSAGDHACATLCEHQMPPIPAPAHFCFATVCNGIEAAGALHDAGVRLPGPLFGAAPHALSAADGGDSFPESFREAAVPPRPADYYVFSLEHILI